MSAIATAVVASSVVGAVASDNAADAQADAASDANAAQLQMFNTSRRDQAPWRDVGEQALNELAMRLGIGGSGSSGSYYGGAGGTPLDSLAGADLVDTSTGIPKPNEELYATNADYRNAWNELAAIHDAEYGKPYNQASSSSNIEAALRSKLSAQLARDIAAQQESTRANPLYGSLSRSFTKEDFQADPGYEFRLAEGMRGINNSAAARGGLLSGAALKAASRYNQGFASNEYNNVYNRWNNDRTQQFNRLASLAGVGQTAATQIGNQAMQTGQAVANNITGAGNARASGYVGTANALNGAIGQGVNMWQQNQLMNSLNSGGYGGYVNNAYSNGFGEAFTNMSNPAYG